MSLMRRVLLLFGAEAEVVETAGRVVRRRGRIPVRHLFEDEKPKPKRKPLRETVSHLPVDFTLAKADLFAFKLEQFGKGLEALDKTVAELAKTKAERDTLQKLADAAKEFEEYQSKYRRATGELTKVSREISGTVAFVEREKRITEQVSALMEMAIEAAKLAEERDDEEVVALLLTVL